MRRNAALYTLLAFEAIVALLSLGFHMGPRVRVLEAFHTYETPIPVATRVALSPLLLPVTHGVALAMITVAWLAGLRRSRRNAILAAAVFLSASTFIFAIVAAFLPIFQP